VVFKNAKKCTAKVNTENPDPGSGSGAGSKKN